MRTAVATMASTWPSSDTSTVTGVAEPPASTISATADSAWSATTSAATTWAPSAAKRAAATRPIPLPAPVITATLPSSRAISVSLSGLQRPSMVCGEGVGLGPGCTHSTGTLPAGRDGGGILIAVPTAGPRPLIGVTTYRQTTSWWSWERDAAVVPGRYLDVIEEAGGEAVLLPPRGERAGPLEAARCERVVGALGGLVVIGGGDLDAARYGADPDPRNGGTSVQRDDLELGLIGAALAIDLPLLAVCRGMQVLNVCLGGDLVQQLPDRLGTSAHQPRPGAFGPVAVITEEGSTVRGLLGARTEVLCSHHQAVERLGEGLVVTARSEDGVVEAVELPGHRFVVGIQWHPEETGDRRLFGALVDAATATEPIEHPPIKETL